MSYNPSYLDRKFTVSRVDEAQVVDTQYSVDGVVTKSFESQQLHARNCKKCHIRMLYGTLCNTVNIGKSYTFECVKLRTNDDDRFLCTIPDTDIIPLDHDIEFDAMLTTSSFATLDPVVTGHVISVKN